MYKEEKVYEIEANEVKKIRAIKNLIDLGLSDLINKEKLQQYLINFNFRNLDRYMFLNNKIFSRTDQLGFNLILKWWNDVIETLFDKKFVEFLVNINAVQSILYYK